LIEGVKATCYPAKEFVELINNYTGANVEVDKNVITANGPKSAMEFSIKICEYLKLPCGI
jgi:putative intracellular protease/amidase